MNNDPYDPSVPKYSTASEIYDALKSLTDTEEMSILSEIVPDVSYDGQDYYYYDKGYEVLTRFDKASGYGERLWALDMAIWQMDQNDIYDVIWDALHNPDLARRLQFKSVTVETLLYGRKAGYEKFAEDFRYEMSELDRGFDFHSVLSALGRIFKEEGREQVFYVPQYHRFIDGLCKNAKGLRLYEEKQIITESRALLTSYDDFMLGLKMNQALHEYQEQQYGQRVARLNEAFDEKVRQLYQLAQAQGIVLPAKEVALIAEFAPPPEQGEADDAPNMINFREV